MQKRSIFYGWWIVIAIFCISAYISGTIIYSFTAFFQPIADEFDWTYAQVSVAASIRGLEATFLAPLLGLIVDRWGPRRILFFGGLFTGIGLLLLSRTDSLFTFYGSYILLMAATSVGSGVVPLTAVSYWFRKRVTLATGIVISGVAAGGLLVPVVTGMIDTLNWRNTLVVLAFTSLIILPLSLVVRHKPEDYGYAPDGEQQPELAIPAYSALQATDQPAEQDDGGFSLGQAVRNRAFWHIAAGNTCLLLVVSSVNTHVMPYLSCINIDRSVSSLLASSLPLISVIGRLSFGWIGDRINKVWLLSFALFLTALSLVIYNMTDAQTLWLLVPFAILFSIGWGGAVPLLPGTVRERFGKINLGSIMGMVFGVMAIGTLVGPPITGWIFDKYGSYSYAWFTLLTILVLGIIVLITTPRRTTIVRAKVAAK